MIKYAVYLPIKPIRIIQLAQIQRTTLPYELDVASPSRAIIETDEHNVWEIHAAELDIEDAGGGLDLGLQTVGGAWGRSRWTALACGL